VSTADIGSVLSVIECTLWSKQLLVFSRQRIVCELNAQKSWTTAARACAFPVPGLLFAFFTDARRGHPGDAFKFRRQRAILVFGALY
jgi:hypothetical protein